jgi:hypothetical protein
MAKFQRPAVPVEHRGRVARLLILLHKLSHRVKPQLVFRGLSSRIVACRHILEVDVLEVVI